MLLVRLNVSPAYADYELNGGHFFVKGAAE
jgi:hypothetical protein